MQTLTQDEMCQAGGGLAPAVIAVAAATSGATLYGAAKSAYEFGKVLGGMLFASTEPEITASN